jgi:type II secretory pathway pseudopilin PulG
VASGSQRRHPCTGVRSGCSRPAQHGFTYVGMLITVALMTSALAIVAPVWEVASRRDKEAELLFIGGEFQRALVGYAKFGTSTADRYPNQLEDLVKDPRFPGVRRFLRKIYVDPMTNSTDWAVVRPPEGGGIVGVHSKSEKEPIKQSNFPASQKDFEGKTKYSEWVFFDQPRGPAIPAGGLQTPQAGTQPGGLQPPQTTPQPGSIVQRPSPLQPGGSAQQSVGGVPQTTR